MWYPPAERYSTPYSYGALSAVCVVLHRTYGAEAGDMSVALGRARPGISFHFYLPKRGGVRQFLPINVKGAHAKGANSWAVGIEFESRSNDDPLRDAQLDAAAKLFVWLSETLKIPLEYDPGPRRSGKRRGFVAHAAIAGSNHGDRLTLAEWNSIVSRIRPGGSTAITSVPAATVPNVTWLSVEAASAALSRERLVPVVEYVWQGFEAGTVFEQRPAAAATVARGSTVVVRVDEGGSKMSVARYAGHLHSFDVEDSCLVHRWWDPQASRWASEIVAGVKAPGDGFSRDAVTNAAVSCCIWGVQLHAFAGRAHAWHDGKRWRSETLP